MKPKNTKSLKRKSKDFEEGDYIPIYNEENEFITDEPDSIDDAGYTYREEMVGDGIVRMFKALISKKYNREKGTNPFSYFTRIAFNAFRNRIKKEKTIHDAHERYQQEYMIMTEGFANLLKNNQTKITKDNENIIDD